MTNTALTIENLSVQFGDYTVFKDMTLTLPAGKLMAVVGPNGAGKSCLVKTIAGLLMPSVGSIAVFEKAPQKMPFNWLGYVPQLKTLDRNFPGQAIELVMTGLKPAWPWIKNKTGFDMAMSALEKVGAGHLAERPIGKLSGGELQRIYFARCLVRNPRLILLDEPVTGIDMTLATDIFRILETIRQETHATVLMVTHDLAAAAYHADLVLLMNQSTFYVGEPDAVLTQDHLRTIFGHAGHPHMMGLEETPHA